MRLLPRYFFLILVLSVAVAAAQTEDSVNVSVAPADTSTQPIAPGVAGDSAGDESDDDPYSSGVVRRMADTSAVILRTTPDSALAVFRSNPEFDYSKEIQQGISWWELLKSKFWELVNELFSKKGFQQAWDVAEILLIAGAIIALVLFFSKTGVRSLFARNVAVAPDFEIITENIHELDFAALIAQAVRTGEYRRAVRLHYLKILKELTDAGAIAWSPEKTNRDYVRELRHGAENLAGDFLRLTLIFEQVRYGKYDVRLPEYSRLVPEFEVFSAAVGAAKQEQTA